MDPQELEQRKQQARNEGYSEEEINAALGITASAPAAGPASAPVASGPIAPDPELDRSAEQNTILATGAALGAGAIGIPAAIGFGVKAGLSGASNKIGAGMDVAKQGINAMNTSNAVNQAASAGIADRALVSQGAMTAEEAYKRQLAREASMQASKTPVTTTQAPQMTAAKSIVQKLALDKIMRGAGAVAKMAGPATGMAMNLFGTSPEEIATLKAAEARRKALGQ